MTYEKPWLEEFSRLLEDLKVKLGGQIVRRRETPKPDAEWGASLEVGAAYFAYDSFYCELNGIRLEVEISHYALLGDSALVEGNFEEFLVVGAQFQPLGLFRIRPRGFFDRMRKALRFSDEYQTGDTEFDKMFCAVVPDNEDEHLLRRSDIQANIKELMHFEFLQAHRGGIRCSELITDEAQLESDHVIEQLQLVARLALIIRK